MKKFEMPVDGAIAYDKDRTLFIIVEIGDPSTAPCFDGYNERNWFENEYNTAWRAANEQQQEVVTPRPSDLKSELGIAYLIGDNVAGGEYCGIHKKFGNVKRTFVLQATADFTTIDDGLGAGEDIIVGYSVKGEAPRTLPIPNDVKSLISEGWMPLESSLPYYRQNPISLREEATAFFLSLS